MAKPQYRYRHQQERKRWQRDVEQGRASCCLCGAWIAPGQPWDLDHQPGTDEYRGAAHARCNRSDGGKRGNAARNAGPRRWVL